MVTQRPLILWGATGQSRVLAELIDPACYRVVAYVDRSAPPVPARGVAFLSSAEELSAWMVKGGGSGVLYGAVAIGGSQGRDRREIAQLLRSLGVKTPALIHRTAIIARDARIGEAAQILIGAIIGTGARVGASAIVNSGASIDHDCVIGDGAHIGPGAVLAGEIEIGEEAFVGTGAVILPRVQVGKAAIVGAGAVVLGDVAAGATVVGNPARPVADRNSQSFQK